MNHNKLPDTLSLLTIWFKYGVEGNVTKAMNDGFTLVSCDTWLDVVPQVCVLNLTCNFRSTTVHVMPRLLPGFRPLLQ